MKPLHHRKCALFLVSLLVALVACDQGPEVREVQPEDTTPLDGESPQEIIIKIGDYHDQDGSNPPLCGGLSILIRYTINDGGDYKDYVIFENQGNLELYSKIERDDRILADDYACSRDVGDLLGCNLEEVQLGVQLAVNDELIITVEYLNFDAYEYQECEFISITLP